MRTVHLLLSFNQSNALIIPPASYGIQCEYPASTRTAASKPPASGAEGSAAAHLPIRSPEPVSESTIQTSLLDISTRLRSLETSLAKVRLCSTPDDYSESSRHSTTTTTSSSQPHDENSSFHGGPRVTTNPLQTVSETLTRMEALEKETSSALPASPESSPESSRAGLGYRSPPDAIVLGLMSLSECEASFEL
jgi:hypothetical protein